MKTIQNHLGKLDRILFFVLLASSLLFTVQSCNDDDGASVDPLSTQKFQEFDNGMHKLWADHMQYTYATVDAYYNHTASLEASLNRLLANQDEIGAAIVPYYGQAAGDQLATLLRAHITGAVPVLEAARNGDQVALDQAIADWRANGREIADFLSAANPENWPQEHMRMHMDDHLTKTIAYAVDLLQQNYPQAVANYDLAFNDMMHFAASLSEGIAKQFPEKFL